MIVCTSLKSLELFEGEEDCDLLAMDIEIGWDDDDSESYLLFVLVCTPQVNILCFVDPCESSVNATAIDTL